MKNISKRIAGGELAIGLLTGAVSANAPAITGNVAVASAMESIEVAETYNIPFVAHVQSIGWQATRYTNGGVFNSKRDHYQDVYIGTTNMAKRLEAFVIGDPDLQYCVQFAGNSKYEDWVDGAQIGRAHV